MMKHISLILISIILFGCVKESEQIINDAQVKAEQIINDAQEKANQFQKTREKKLHNIFRGLKKYQLGKNVVNRSYLSNFVITNNSKIKYTFVNDGSAPVKPNFKIYFVNTYGFITGEDNVVWLFDKVSRNETRVYERSITIRFGAPTYYFVKFDYL